MKKVVIFGTGYFGKLVELYLANDSEYEVAAFTLNQEYITDKIFRGKAVVAFEEIERFYPPDEYSMFVAIGYNRVNKARAEVYNRCKEKGYELITYVSPKATFYKWGENEIGDNCFIFEHNVIQPFVKIGPNVVIWSGNHIGHDTVIGSHCFITSHCVISGNVTIGPYCFIGVNATLRNAITIAPECVIGAGAVILKDTREKGVYSSKNTEPMNIQSCDLKRI